MPSLDVYADPLPADLVTRFPTFAAVDPATIQQALNEAAGRIDATWPDGARRAAVLLYTAHTLTLDGQGAASEAQLAGFKAIKVGALSLELDTLDATTATDSLASTRYGRRYLELCQVNFAGPVIV